MKTVGDEIRGPRHVRVPGRDDVGEVYDPGRELGRGDLHILCVGVHFPATGEFIYYDQRRVEYVDDGDVIGTVSL